MSPTNPLLPYLSDDEAARLEEAVDRFEDAWRRGERPDPVAFLPRTGPRFAALIELMAVDREYRSAGGGPGRVGRFELSAEVGAGAFGRVYRGFDPDLGRVVAVKVPHPGRPAPADRGRLLREARCAARLRHPNIAALCEVIEADGLPVLVGEFVDGEPLSAWAGRRPVPPVKAAGVAAVLADALHHAHSHGVVHRDVKPSNVLIGRDGVPHLLDFGLARHDAADTLTADGDLLGTPGYMAPEAVRGAGAGPRTDVYSLGVVLYELLTGERPFRGTAAAVLVQIADHDPVPPRQFVPDLSRDLETVCLKAMAREPGDRYPTAAALADDLRRWARGEPVTARPVGAVGRGWRWCRRRPVPAGLAAGLVGAVLLGVAGMGWQWRRADDRRREAEAAAAAVARERDKAEEHFRVTHRAVIDLGGASIPDWGSERPSFQLNNPATQERARMILPYYRFLVRERPGDEEVLIQAAYAEQVVGYAHERAGEYAAAAACYEASLRVFARLRRLAADDTGYAWGEARANFGLAVAYENGGRPADALDPAVRAARRFVELLNGRPDLADRFRDSVRAACRRLRIAVEAVEGPGGAARRLQAEGWLDPPPGPAGPGDRARMAAFAELCGGLAKRCAKAGDRDGERIASGAAGRLSAALGRADLVPVTPGTSPDRR